MFCNCPVHPFRKHIESFWKAYLSPVDTVHIMDYMSILNLSSMNFHKSFNAVNAVKPQKRFVKLIEFPNPKVSEF